MSETRVSYNRQEKQTGRKNHLLFTLVNMCGFALVARDLVSLFALRLQASDTYVGILASMVYFSYFFMPVGRLFVQKYGLIKVFRNGWLGRYLSTLPLIIAPLLTGHVSASNLLLLILLSSIGFNIFRGIGIVSISPITSYTSEGKDRGRYLAQVAIVANFSMIFANVLVALIMGGDSPDFAYSIFFTAGAVLGLYSTRFISRIPEPPASRDSAQVKIAATARHIIGNRNLRTFLGYYLVIWFFSQMFRPFLITYGKRVFDISDSSAIFFIIVPGYLGAIVIGLLIRQFIDRLGAKPMVMAFTFFFCLILAIPAFFVPTEYLAVVCLLIFTAFFSQMSAIMLDSGCQTYFYTIVEKKQLMNLGLIFNLLNGLGGSAGALSGGIILDNLVSRFSGDMILSYRLFFLLIAAGLLLSLLLANRLARLGAHSLGRTVVTLFSPRDLRAIVISNRLSSNVDSIGIQRQQLRKLADNSSYFSIDLLVDLLASPSYAIRIEALNAMSKNPLNSKARGALIDHLTLYPHTTAYLAARILGSQRVAEAAKPLLQVLRDSDDQMLKAGALLALARLGEKKIVPIVEKILPDEQQPTLLLNSLAAIANMADKRGINILLNFLGRVDLPPYIIDEALYALSDLLDLSIAFHRLYSLHQNDRLEMVDILEEMLTSGKKNQALTLNKNLTAAMITAQTSLDQSIWPEIDKLINKGAPADQWSLLSATNKRMLQAKPPCFGLLLLIILMADKTVRETI